jgi:transcription-repair coupling factor (superfamily II helicase)
VPTVETLADFLAGDEKVAITAAPLTAGFFWHEPEAQLAVQFITETELFASAPAPAPAQAGADQQRRRADQGPVRAEGGRPGGALGHGIGRYQGLVSMDTGRSPSEFLHLEYADKATLYVPVSQLHLISRYTGVSAEAPLHKLGSGQWEKAKRKAAEQVRDTAAELLNIYARAPPARACHRFSPHDYEAFAASFGFEETPDQQAAIHAVIQDMISPRPMDRLVCGDVGFGKTEVALRAAFVAVHAGKQVALLAPTTLLAEQHYQTIVDRFAKWPVKVAELSRFRSAKEVKAALEGIADGSIDIVVGTHKLLSKDVQFKRLGLLIIDEEHRFGVRHKEAMKALRAEVDVLTLTATPIPHPGHGAGGPARPVGDRHRAAAPPGHQDLRAQRGQGVIREAVLRELKRGGQVYFLHNEVETIENRRQALAELMPEARIGVAHGQMPERELERVMRDFTTSASTCCCARPSSRPASTCPAPTPSSSAAPTSSAWPSCTSCAAAWAAATTRPMPTCWCPMWRA